MAWRRLTDVQWARLKEHLPTHPPSPRGGRPRADDRKCFEGILWILWTGAPWSELPRKYGSPTTCWRRLFTWEEDGTLLNLWRAFLADLNDREKLRWDECFADGSFAPAKKGGPKSARRSEAKVRSGCFWSMARVLRCCRDAYPSTRQTPMLSRPPDRRPGLRQLCSATLVEDPRHRAHHSGKKQQQPGDAPGWPKTATVWSPLDHRTDIRLDRVVSASPGAP